jgi:hypothetical protein
MNYLIKLINLKTYEKSCKQTKEKKFKKLIGQLISLSLITIAGPAVIVLLFLKQGNL